MNYRKQIFDMLGVEPYERFKIKGEEGKFYIAYDLSINNEHQLESPYRFISILTGKSIIIKIPQWTEEEKIIAKFAKAEGYCYIAKDIDNGVCLYKKKPVEQDEGYWQSNTKYMLLMSEMPHITTDRVYSVDEIIEGK